MVNTDLRAVVWDGHAVVGWRGELTGRADVFSIHPPVERAELACARHRPV